MSPSVTAWLSDVFMDSDGARTKTFSLLFFVFLEILMTIRKIYIFCLNMLAPQGLFFLLTFFRLTLHFESSSMPALRNLVSAVTLRPAVLLQPVQTNRQTEAEPLQPAVVHKMEIKNRFYGITQQNRCLYLDIF